MAKCAVIFILVNLCNFSLAFPFKKDQAGDTFPRVDYTGSDQNDYRLPQTFRPLHYDLMLKPDLSDCEVCRFNGTVRIWLKALEETDELVLHFSGAEIRYLIFNNTGISLVFDRDREFVKGRLPGRTKKGGEYEVVAGFGGYMEATTFGFYRVAYVQNGTERVMAATNLAPTFARKVFPCLDEPSYRATFNISVHHPATHTAISNADINQQIHRDDYVITMFERTPSLPTYLIAVVVTEYTYVETFTENGIRVRTWVSCDDVGRVEGATELAKRALTLTEEYLDMPYPLTKLDQVSIPDFVYSGMENLGLVMYAPEVLVWQEETTNHIDTICHEIVHQWFGDLVTMKWWSDLWMKEGFTQSISWTICRLAAPNTPQDYFKRFYSAWRKDSYETSQPLRYPNPRNNADISATYDANILYMKGGAVMSMFSDVFGKSNFRRLLQDYLAKNLYSSVDQKAWFTAAQEGVETFGLRDGTRQANMEKFMASWLWQKGFPLVSVNRTKNGLILRQERFLEGTIAPHPFVENAKVNFTSPFGYRWEIPFRFMTNATRVHDPNQIIWMHQESSRTEFVSSDLPVRSWVLANPGFTGFYRVNYDTQNWRKLIDQLYFDHQEIPEKNRLQLISDSFALARNHRLSYEVAFGVAGYLRGESSVYPWQVFVEESQLERNMLAAKPGRASLQAYMKRLVSLNYASASWLQGENYRDLDVMTISLACEYGLDDCSLRALQLYKDRHILHLPDELEEVMYCTSVKISGDELWNQLYNETRDANWSNSSKMKGLTCSPDPSKVLSLLTSVIGNEMVPPFEQKEVIKFALRNHLTLTETLDILLRNWNKLADLLVSPWPMMSLVSHLQKTLNSELHLRMVINFLQTQRNAYGKVPDYLNSLPSVLEKNLDWMKLDYAEVTSALENINDALL